MSKLAKAVVPLLFKYKSKPIYISSLVTNLELCAEKLRDAKLTNHLKRSLTFFTFLQDLDAVATLLFFFEKNISIVTISLQRKNIFTSNLLSTYSSFILTMRVTF